MEWMKNTSNVTSTSSPSPMVLTISGYLALNCLWFVVICPLQLSLNGATFASILASRAFRKAPVQRNLLLGITAVSVLNSLIVVILVALNTSEIEGLLPTSTNPCRAGTFLYNIGVPLRNLYWVTLAISMFIIIKYGVEKIRVIFLTASMIIMVGAVTLLSIPFLTPLYTADRLDGVLCVQRRSTPLALVHQILHILIVGFPTQFVVVVFVIIILVYVKKTAITLNRRINQAMVKLCVLLLTVSFAILGTTIIYTLAVDQEVTQSLAFRLWAYIISTFLLVGLPEIVIPIVIIVVFTPVRQGMRRIITCKCKHEEGLKVSGDQQSASNANLCIAMFHCNDEEDQ